MDCWLVERRRHLCRTREAWIATMTSLTVNSSKKTAKFKEYVLKRNEYLYINKYIYMWFAQSRGWFQTPMIKIAWFEERRVDRPLFYNCPSYLYIRTTNTILLYLLLFTLLFGCSRVSLKSQSRGFGADYKLCFCGFDTSPQWHIQQFPAVNIW